MNCRSKLAIIFVVCIWCLLIACFSSWDSCFDCLLKIAYTSIRKNLCRYRQWYLQFCLITCVLIIIVFNSFFALFPAWQFYHCICTYMIVRFFLAVQLFTLFSFFAMFLYMHTPLCYLKNSTAGFVQFGILICLVAQQSVEISEFEFYLSFVSILEEEIEILRIEILNNIPSISDIWTLQIHNIIIWE